MKLDQLLSKHSLVGVIGNRNQGKSMTIVSQLLQLRKKYPTLSIAVLGVEDSLLPLLENKNIHLLYSKMDILDLKMQNTVIFIDEFALMFDSQKRSKQQTKLMRFFDRIEHNNCKLVMGTAREGFFNKFMCSRLTAFIVKEVELDALVNGTWLQEKIKALNSRSDYRFECPKDEFYVVTNKDELTQKHYVKYDVRLDTKKDNVPLFGITSKKVQIKVDKKEKKVS